MTHTDAEWRGLLSPQAYDVLRQQGTEMPEPARSITSSRAGRYDCAGCALPVFASATKFDSGTGWPSFYQPLDHAVSTESDSSMLMERTEVHCMPLRRPSGPCVRGRAEAHRAALLHERRGARHSTREPAYDPLHQDRSRRGCGPAARHHDPARAGARRGGHARGAGAGHGRACRAGPQTAVLSGGCFWGVQGVFEHVRGVQRVLAGYSGGAPSTASYETVSGGDTGHAESVQITYDPKQISYGRILQIFFSVALDPTMKDAQGPDSGTQYRSEVFYATPEQPGWPRLHRPARRGARLSRADRHQGGRPAGFYPAEAYHQDFLETHPDYPYIVVNDMPKVEALKTLFPADYTARAVTTGTKS